MREVENRSLERDRQAPQSIVTVAAAQYLKLFPPMSGHEPFHCASFLFAYDACSFDHAITALDQEPLKDFGSCDLVVAITGMKTGMVFLRLLVRQAEEFARNRDEPPGHSIKSDGRVLIKRLAEHHSKATEVLGGLPMTSSARAGTLLPGSHPGAVSAQHGQRLDRRSLLIK